MYYEKEIDMTAVTVSPKYQIVIPRALREKMNITPGKKMQVICLDGRIELVLVRPVREMRFFFEGV